MENPALIIILTWQAGQDALFTFTEMSFIGLSYITFYLLTNQGLQKCVI